MKLKYIVVFILFLINSLSVSAQNDICLGSQDFKVVVLGSSTSAGSGTSNLDSAWVNRYRSYLQEINPNNEVINLGVGGYNTYRIMRTGFTPPPGRPTPDVVRNITAAINESPDAIIVNMPSNDVSAGYSYQEQMDNLDSIVELSGNFGIPIWICSTQPRNFSDTNQLNLQWEIKDSIYAHFDPRTIDFWSTIALPDYTIDAVYDSGDGVHLNDLGHGLLFDRVRDKHIIDSLYEPNVYTDYAMLDLESMNSVCGDSSSAFQMVIGNIGSSNTDTVFINFELENTTSGGVIQIDTIIPNGLLTCTSDTIVFIANTYDEGEYDLTTTLTNFSDTIIINDSLMESFFSIGHPTILDVNDTLCDTGIIDISVISEVEDTVFWYSDLFSSIAIGNGPQFSALIDTTTTYYAQSVRGDLFFKDEVIGSTTSTINWNGTMFDLVAHENLVIDSIGLKIESLGTQIVDVFYKPSTHIGYELTPLDWTMLDSIEVNVTSNTDLTMLPITFWELVQQDTVGVYLQLRDPSSNLSYKSVPNSVTHVSNELSMITGSGISHDFSGSYYPRDFCGGIFYHYGNRPLGDCATERIPVVGLVSEIELTTSSDTIIDINANIFVHATAGMSYYEWFDGSNDSIIEINAADLGTGIHYISLFSIDSLGCEHNSEFVLGVADLVGIEELNFEVNIYPNPVYETLTIQCPMDYKVYFTDVNGSSIDVTKLSNSKFDLSEIQNGVYFIEVITSNQRIIKKIIKLGK